MEGLLAVGWIGCFPCFLLECLKFQAVFCSKILAKKNNHILLVDGCCETVEIYETPCCKNGRFS